MTSITALAIRRPVATKMVYLILIVIFVTLLLKLVQRWVRPVT